MESEILISRAFCETRVAVLEGATVRELYVERDHKLGVVGNIYKGRATRVLPGMQAAFVQIGLDRAAFLYVDDIFVPEDLDEDETKLDEDEDEEVRAPKRERPSISSLLREGQEIIVQVQKAPLGTKGARVTSYVTLPGRYVVYMPTMSRVGVSRKITSEAERRRLREVMTELRKPGEGGFIARTVCAGLDRAEIEQDMDLTRSLWAEIVERIKTAPVPSLLQADLDLVLRATRDLFTNDVKRMILDDAEQAARVRKLLSRFAPNLVERVETAEPEPPLFDRYGIEATLERSLMREIELKSGGSIVIDEAEALTAIDVNTGSFVGGRDLEATILKTNLEAAGEIAAQVRLRNLGGIIIIDFIDMQEAENREKVYQAFLEALTHDRAKTHVLAISGFGLIEMTRKRVRPSLSRVLTAPCPYCEGRGRIRSRRTMCYEVFREVTRQAQAHPIGQILVRAMPEVAAMLSEEEQANLLDLENRLGRSIVVEARSDLHQEVYQVSVRAPSTAL